MKNMYINYNVCYICYNKGFSDLALKPKCGEIT